MALQLHFHPLASFCQKVLIALYENDTPFEPRLVDLGDAASSAAFKALWPIGKMPVLVDTGRGRVVPESSIIIEYLAQHYPGQVPLVPADPDLALDTRLGDRFYDHYIHQPMQKIVVDKLRPEGMGDPFGVEEARRTIRTAYAMIERDMADKPWAAGDAFGMADCAAAPSLFYALKVEPAEEGQRNLAAYFARLMARASFVRVVEEAKPYFASFPG